MWEAFTEWFLSLGDQYGVNPIIFGSIYVGAIPFFTLSVGWLVRNLRRKKPIVLPALSASFFFIRFIIQQSKVCQQLFDFFAIKERHAADQNIR